MVVNHPVDLFPVFVAMVVAEFIDHKKEDDKGDRQRDGEAQGIDSGIEFVSPQKSKGGKEVVSDHLSWGIKMIQLI